MVDNDAPNRLLPPMAWNAWGDPDAAKPLSDGIRGLLEQALGVTPADDPRSGHRRGAAAALGAHRHPPRRPDRDRRRRLPPHRRPRPPAVRRRQVHTGPVAAQADSPGRPGRRDAARRRGRDRGRAGLLLPPPHRRGALRRRHQRGRRPGPDPRRVRLRHLTGPASSRRTALARRDLPRGRTRRRCHRTRRRATAGRTWFLAGPLPAELPVRHHRRLRGHPLLRPEFRRLRAVQRHGPRTAGHHPGRCAGPRPRPRVGRRAGPSRAVHRLRGRVRHHHPRAAAGASRHRRPRSTRRGRSRTSPPAPPRCAR